MPLAKSSTRISKRISAGNAKAQADISNDSSTTNGKAPMLNGTDNFTVENGSQGPLTNSTVAKPCVPIHLESSLAGCPLVQISSQLQDSKLSTGVVLPSPNRNATMEVVSEMYSTFANPEQSNNQMLNKKDEEYSAEIKQQSQDLSSVKIKNRNRRTKKLSYNGDSATKDLPVPQRSSRRQSPGTLPREVKDNVFDTVFEVQHDSNESPVSNEVTKYLCALDESSYLSSLAELADEIYHEKVFPSCYPWYKSKVLLAASTPRDIDEMASIIKCEYSLESSIDADGLSDNSTHLKMLLCDALNIPEIFNTDEEPWKYSSHIFSSRSIFEKPFHVDGGMGYSPRLFEQSMPSLNNIRAHVIRSNDPGVLLMTIVLKPFFSSSDDDHVISEEKLKFVKSSNVLPWSWNKIQKKNFLQCKQRDMFCACREDQIEYARTYTRKLKISVKVACASSRNSLFPGGRPLKEDPDPNSELHMTLSGNVHFKGCVLDNTVVFRKVKPGSNFPNKRPRITIGNMPALVQNGNTISFDAALAEELDTEESSNPLGSYDCRPTNLVETHQEELLGKSSESGNHQLCIASRLTSDSHKNKRINIGRTRVIWSTLPCDGFGQPIVTQPGPGVRLPFVSMLTNGKMDSTEYKRPRDVHVAVRVDGEIVTESSGVGHQEEKRTTSSAVNLSSPSSVVTLNFRHKRGKKRTVSLLYEWELRNQLNTEAIIGSCIDATAERKERSAFYNNWTNATIMVNRSKFFNQVMKVKLHKSSVQSKGSSKTADASIFNDTWMATALARKHYRNQSKQPCPQLPFTEMKNNSTDLFQYLPPRLECFPLDDGNVRTVCVTVGTLKAVSVQSLMSKLCAGENENSINLCSICWDCSEDNDEVRMCSNCGICAHISCCFDDGELVPTGSSVNWRCAVCCSRFTKEVKLSPILQKKRRRSLKLPAKFRGTEYDLSTTKSSNNDTIRSSGKITDSISGDSVDFPKCFFCPHSGGVMSKLSNSFCKNTDSVWAHDLCQLWSRPIDPVSGTGQSHQVCCLCGKTNGSPCKSNSAMDATIGLIKCAGKGCFVHFHAMCALLVTRGRSKTDDKLENGKRRFSRLDRQNIDTQHCLDYTLDVIEVTSNSSSPTSSFVPIAYCGIHNPRRDDDYFGLPACGGAIVSSMRIPGANQDISKSYGSANGGVET